MIGRVGEREWRGRGIARRSEREGKKDRGREIEG